MELELKSMDYHRNGICGLGFYVMIANDGESDKLIVRFPKEADKETGSIVCAVFDMNKLKEGNIAFFENSFRGDHYSGAADKLIESTPSDQHACALRRETARDARPS